MRLSIVSRWQQDHVPKGSSKHFPLSTLADRTELAISSTQFCTPTGESTGLETDRFGLDCRSVKKPFSHYS
ncbi:unnamed protein product [Protopolystoma xenopodis]|uniref:Uncharacterized protein n=1 Tax=Protopolystoma xenopodis TaxID=117903 RepID=A0A3S5CHY5_9PLAT|nr:unnamed protein product [Protopolystoma xenopodis]